MPELNSPPDDGTLPFHPGGGARRSLAGPPAEMPAAIGPFRLRELLGEGGMGRVYLAEQAEPVRRRVALKVVREVLRGPRALSQFNAERQALARLAHPAIAQLYEAGATEDGYPYFAMEWVDGAPITLFCRQRNLNVAARLRLMVEVCRGVEHAHQRQVLHRDLKASNILVTEIDGRPMPKIIDFGIAKGLDNPLSEATQATGDRLLGTPHSMSPEALGLSPGGVDTRSDVYALGLVLYELLTGAAPYPRRETLGELLSDRTGALPPRPSVIQAQLAGDLDWIVMKAIRFEREERYSSAAAFADDIERLLADQPILARPPSTLYLLRKLTQRHGAAVIAGGMGLLLLVAGIVGTSLALVRARRAEAQASREAATSEQVADFLGDLFRGADPSRFQGGKVSARDLLESGSARLASSLETEPLVRARLLGQVGDIYRKLGMFDEAQGLLQQSLRLSEEVLPSSDPELGRALARLGGLEAGRGRYAEAEPLLLRALALFTASESPDLAEIAAVESELGVVDFSQGRAQDAAAHFERAVSAAERSLPTSDPLLAKAVGNLAATKQRLGDLEAALALALRALELEESSGRGETSGLGYRLVNLGAIQGRLNRMEESLESYRRAYDVLTETLGTEHPPTLSALMNEGVAHRKLGRMDEAERLFRVAASGFKAKLGSDHPQTADCLFKLGLLLWQQGRLAEAEAIYRERAAIFRRVGETTRDDLREELSFVGTLVLAQGRSREAEELLREAVAASVVDPTAPEPYGLAFAYAGLGTLCRDSGRSVEAEAHYRRALEIVSRLEQDPARSQHHAPSRQSLVADFARLLVATGRTSEAAALR